MFNVPGRAAGVYARDNTVATVMMVFASPPIDHDQRDVAKQMQVVTQAYRRRLKFRSPRHAVGTRRCLAAVITFPSPALVERPGRAGRDAMQGDRAAWERVRPIIVRPRRRNRRRPRRSRHRIRPLRADRSTCDTSAGVGKNVGRSHADQQPASGSATWCSASCPPAEETRPRKGGRQGGAGSSCRTIRRSVRPSRKARSKSRTSWPNGRSATDDALPVWLTDMDDKKACVRSGIESRHHRGAHARPLSSSESQRCS